MNKFACAVLVVAFIGISNAQLKLQERYNWRQLDWVFPNLAVRDRLIASGDYVPTNGLPVGIERWQNKLFVTVPRWRNGIPAVLNYIDMDQTPSGSPALIPYPSLENNVAGDCANGLSTVYRIKADRCGRLWVLDTGTVGIGNTTRNVCPYALNVFDLATDRRIRRYEFQPEDTNANTFIANIAVDIGRNCEDTQVYFSDELGYGLISYSWEQNRSWRFAHSFFFPDPLRGDFNVAGLNFQWGEEGIFGMALSPIQNDGFRTLYFSPLASFREFSVSTRILRDSTRLEESFHDFAFFQNERIEGHSTSRVMSETGIELFNLIDQNAIGCWDSATPYSPQNHGTVDRDDETLVFPADVKIDETNTVWVISDRMPVFLITELDYNDINFRIFSAPLETLIAGTVCDGRKASRPPYTVNRFAPVQPIAVIPVEQVPSTTSTRRPNYTTYFQDYSTENDSSLSPGYNSKTTKIIAYTAPSTAAIIATSKTPKAFVYNQHNGVTYKAETPAYVGFYPSYYTPSPTPSHQHQRASAPVPHYNQHHRHRSGHNEWNRSYYKK